MTQQEYSLDPCSHGWYLENGIYQLKLQEKSDPLYSKPQAIQVSCSCTSECKKCKCINSQDVQGKCSRLLCKKCSCFKRQKESVNENLALSDEYQKLLDELSSEDENTIDDEFEEEGISEDETLLETSDYDDIFFND